MFSIDIRQLNRCDAFLSLWVVYYLQGILYPEGGIISIGILAINLLVSIYYAVKVIDMPDKPIYIRGLTWLVIMFSIYGFWLILTNGSMIHYQSGVSKTSYEYIKAIYISLLPIYPFYHFTVEGYLTEERMKRWIFIFFISCTLSFYKKRQEVLQQFLELGISRDEITNNSGYLFLSLFPSMLLLRRTPFLMLSGVIYICAFMIMGMKRGAILIGVFVVAYFIYETLRYTSSDEKWKVYIIVLAAIVCIVILAIHQMHTSDYAIQRIEETKEGRSSGRDEIYSFFWDYFVHKADIIHYLFGRGAYGTLEINRDMAHNDWLEIAINQGVLGIAIFGFYWRNFYRTWKECVNPIARQIIFLVLFIFFMRTFFSQSYDAMSFVVTSALGYALGICNTFEYQEEIEEYDSYLEG